VNHAIRLERDIAEDVMFLFIDKKFCQCCGMQLRLTPSEGEYKEEMGKI
jgi:hypothetical protein